MASSNLQHHYFPTIYCKTWCFQTKHDYSTFNNIPPFRKDLQEKHHKKQKYSIKVIRPEYVHVPQATELQDLNVKASERSTINGYVSYIQKMLNTMGDGRTSVSPYDTAWIALVKNLKGLNLPQFPSSLEWIANNQLSDGSWGDKHFFLAYDRILNTLACVVALRSWNVHAQKVDRGIIFIKENIRKLGSEDEEHMPCGFEIVFPALLQRAKNLGIDGIPYDDPVIQEIHSARDRKMRRIPKDLMHKVPTSLLFSLEGLQDLDWEKLLKLQTPLGSFLTSPSSTAFALMETKDENCLTFLGDIVQKHNGGAPHSYPADLFPRLWAIDRLQRLGISRFFESQITDLLNYVYRFWTGEGIFSARYSRFSDIDDTSMAFRLFRLHGFSVNPDVFKHFMIDDKFYCYGGQMIESATPIYNLYRASQVRFPGEHILEKAKEFSYSFLQEKLNSNQLSDKWIISEGLLDEIRKGLELPWYADLPRIEARFYIEQYGGEDDVWIGKTLYRMPDISNNLYRDLAKLDYNRCQAQHQVEWNDFQEWYANNNLQDFGITKKYLIGAYFLAAASIFEPERSNVRLAWAKSKIICKIVTSYCNQHTISSSDIDFSANYFRQDTNGVGQKCFMKGQRIFNLTWKTLDQLIEDAGRIIGKDISHELQKTWESWMMKQNQGGENNDEAQLLVDTINICAGYIVSEQTRRHLEYKNLSNLTNKICKQLRRPQSEKVLSWLDDSTTDKLSGEIKSNMQELVELVFYESDVADKKVKQTFLVVAKTFYYEAYCPQETVDFHVSKVLFEQVV